MSEYIITTEQLNFFTGYMPDDAMIPAKMAHLQPVVRCRDCKKWDYLEDEDDDGERYGDCDEFPGHIMWESGFCKWGVRS